MKKTNIKTKTKRNSHYKNTIHSKRHITKRKMYRKNQSNKTIKCAGTRFDTRKRTFTNTTRLSSIPYTIKQHKPKPSPLQSQSQSPSQSQSQSPSQASITRLSSKQKITTNNATDDLISQLDRILKKCKKLEYDINHLHSQKRRICHHANSCNRSNPQHYIDYAHPEASHVLAQPFKQCADKFINISYRLFVDNSDQFPTDWYITVANYLRESDYTKYSSLYFNILANLCIHHSYYIHTYPNKQFWMNLYMGLEEGAAVTGMFDVSNIPVLRQCLIDIGSIDTRYLSNTALIFSKSYGKR